MDTILLNVASRKPEKGQASKLRAVGKIPGVLYGKGKESVPFEVDEKEFIKIYKKAGENSIVDLKIDDKDSLKIIIHEIVQHPVSESILCIDLLEIDMKKPVKTSVTLKFVGISPAVKDFGGVFLTKKEDIEISCLPSNLLHEIEVDISGLLNIGDNIHVGDITFPDTVELVDSEELLVAQVIMPRSKIADDAEAAEEAAAGEAGEAGAADAEKPEAGEEKAGEQSEAAAAE